MLRAFKKLKRIKKHGFLNRSKYVLNRRRNKKRTRLAVTVHSK